MTISDNDDSLYSGAYLTGHPALALPTVVLGLPSDQNLIAFLPATNNNSDDDITQDDDDCYQEARMSLNVQVINTSIIFLAVPQLAWTPHCSPSLQLLTCKLVVGSHRRGPLQVGQH